MKQFTCISCPVGCHLTVTTKEDGTYKIQGFQCKRGLEFGRQEMIEARRNFSSTLKIENGIIPLLPVRTSAPFPKDKIFDAMKLIQKAQAAAPIKVGSIIINNILNTGIDIIATRSIGKQ